MAQAWCDVKALVGCPPLSEGGLARDIRQRGNIPVQVGSACMLELTVEDIAENWSSVRALRKSVAAAMVAELGHQLCCHDDDEDDEEGFAGAAAACLFLSLHHCNVPLDQAMTGCRVLFDDAARRERVECLT
jgi:hypothetical protein